MIDRSTGVTAWIRRLGTAWAAGYRAYGAYTDVREAIYAGDIEGPPALCRNPIR